MATRIWIFLINTFFSNTFKSMKNALSLTQDHLAKLTANEADADILAIKTAYLPLHTAFITANNQLDSKLGIYKGKTQTTEEMMEELGKVKINEWRGPVFAVFPEGTDNATAIFPRDRQPFQSGTYDERIEAVNTLSLTLATYTAQPSLVALSASVQAYYLTLSGARALQQSNEGTVATLRTNLKAAHLLMCQGMYKNLGLLMAKYYQNPETVADYFDLTLLRDTGSDEPIMLDGNINSLQVVNLNSQIPDANIDENSVFTMKNTSASVTQLYFYAADAADKKPDGFAAIILNPGEELSRSVADLGFSETNTYFNIYNPGAEAGSWEVAIEE
ncbi:MAG: hypothetical protein IPH78_12445 [Bacteroidetes bacterium]|nr:hypothetical protein [Bacteroidota bacterium]